MGKPTELGRANTLVASLATEASGPRGDRTQFGRFGKRFRDVLLATQALTQEGRTAEIATLLKTLYGGVEKAPALVLAILALAQIDVADVEAARRHIEAWLPKGRSRLATESPDLLPAATEDYSRVLHVYTVHLLVPAEAETEAIRTISEDVALSAVHRAKLEAAVATAVEAREEARAAAAAKERKAAEATAAKEAAAREAVSTAEPISTALSARPGQPTAPLDGTSPSPSLADRARTLLLWLTTLLQTIPKACRDLDPARVGGAVVALVAVLALLRRVLSSTAGGAAVSNVFAELSWAVEKALAGLV